MRSVGLMLMVLLMAAAGSAADGRIEINQAAVEAAGGFPYAIDAPGSYVLTGDLVVATDVGAIAINILGGVTIDLNGFHIKGSATCVLGSCGQGAAIGLSGPPFFGFGSNIAVHGGEISRFSGSCIALGSLARVERMHVSQCGRNGIFVGGGGSVTGNLVISTGENGILLDEGSVYAHNSVRSPNLGGAGKRAIRGGVATAGNYCDDASCARVPRRGFYLTVGDFFGDSALGACAAGHRMASVWELHDLAGLRYDTGLGRANSGDQGGGPPSDRFGWIRGSPNTIGNPTGPGAVSCGGWTQRLGGDGSILALETFFDVPPNSVLDPWVAQTSPCSILRPVWCVED